MSKASIFSPLPSAPIKHLSKADKLAYVLCKRLHVSFIIETKDERIGANINIPRGFICDLASVPKISLVQPVRFPIAAIVHDYLYAGDDLHTLREILYSIDIQPRYFADCVLYSHCKQVQCLNRERSIYTAVRLFGGSHCNWK